MAANLYARSIFGEDALANVSIEKPIHLGPDAPVNGHIRIRAKSQVGSGSLHVHLYMVTLSAAWVYCFDISLHR